MSITLSLVARIGLASAIMRKTERVETLSSIEWSLRSAVTDPLLKQCLRVEHLENEKLSIQLHPAAEVILFWFEEDGNLHCQTTTHAAGPGYHAFLVDLLDHIALINGWKWEVIFNNEHSIASLYWQTREFSMLQSEMMRWLLRTTDVLLQEGVHSSRLCLPETIYPAGNYFIATPLGFWSKQWFQQLSNASISELAQFGADFFPWWERDLTALAWKKAGLVIAWCILPWHAPGNLDEVEAYRITLECFARARELEPTILLPECEINEIQQLLDKSVDSCHAPVGSGIGFLRRNIVKTLPDGWTVNLPGHYYTTAVESRAPVYGFGNTRVYFSTINTQEGYQHTFPAQNLMRKMQYHIPEKNHGVHTQQREDMLGCVAISPAKEGKEEFWTLHGIWAMENNVCLVTVCFHDLAQQNEAMSIWDSIARVN